MTAANENNNFIQRLTNHKLKPMVLERSNGTGEVIWNDKNGKTKSIQFNLNIKKKEQSKILKILDKAYNE